MAKFNHLFSIAFEVNSNNGPENVTGAELRSAIERRLQVSDKELVEACGMPDETAEDDE